MPFRHCCLKLAMWILFENKKSMWWPGPQKRDGSVAPKLYGCCNLSAFLKAWLIVDIDASS